jgi:hypothetical protein
MAAESRACASLPGSIFTTIGSSIEARALSFAWPELSGFKEAQMNTHSEFDTNSEDDAVGLIDLGAASLLTKGDAGSQREGNIQARQLG